MTAEQQGSDESGEGLSEDEREWGRSGYGVLWFEQRSVERILADRLAAVQAEVSHRSDMVLHQQRRAELAEAERDRLALAIAAPASVLAEDLATAWAERDAARRDADELRGRLAAVEALADEWAGITGDNTTAIATWHDAAYTLHAALRAALANPSAALDGTG